MDWRIISLHALERHLAHSLRHRPFRSRGFALSDPFRSSGSRRNRSRVAHLVWFRRSVFSGKCWKRCHKCRC